MQDIFFRMLDVIHEYAYGVGGFSLGVILLCMIILIYQDDMKKSFLVYGLFMALAIVLFPTFAWFVYTYYNIDVYATQLCLLPVIPVAAYTVFRTVELRGGRKKYLALAFSIFLFVMACSFSNLNFSEFKFYNEETETQSEEAAE